MKSEVKIGKRRIGAGSPVYFIAEIGSNHDGDLDRAKELVRACKYAGADAFKIQSFTAEGLVNPYIPDGDGGWVANPSYELIDRLTVPVEWHAELMEFARETGIEFLSAPFDSGRAGLLDDIGMRAFKIASGDITNLPLLSLVASYGRCVILSTGASSMDEVRRAVETITGAGNDEVVLLHCAALYPPAYDEVNLRAMCALASEFGSPVGLSDHTPGATVALGAVALGASLIEKHITTDRSLEGPDHPYAMEVEEFRAMVNETRDLEAALGSGVKEASKGEEEMRVIARRGIYAREEIRKGAVITAEMLRVVRPARGLEPGRIGSVVGRIAARDIHADRPVTEDDL